MKLNTNTTKLEVGMFCFHRIFSGPSYRIVLIWDYASFINDFIRLIILLTGL